jgi:glycosyltransferase involved in cell wall biosynthesis
MFLENSVVKFGAQPHDCLPAFKAAYRMWIMKSMAKKMLSVIIPVYNEEENLPELIERLTSVRQGLNLETELIFVDNCSTDTTGEIITKYAANDSSVKYIRFSRNFGPTVEASLAAGYLYSKGDAAIVIYSDLQDPPELIPQFVRNWEAGFDIVYGVQTKRKGEPAWRRAGVRLFYNLFKSISEAPTMQNSGDFKLISRRVIDQLNQLTERARFSRGLISWLGFSSVGVAYEREPRTKGKSNAHLFAIIGTAFTGLTSFSLRPLRILTGVGFATTLFSGITMAWHVIVALVGQPQPGITTLAVLSLLTMGLNMGALGLIGEYVGRIQLEVKQRPLFVVDKSINVN